jgi:hypothetical protein
VHEEGYLMEIADAGQEVQFFRPDGRESPVVPHSPPAPADPVAALAKTHADQGITPDQWTSTPDWHGETLDYGLAIDMLRRPRVDQVVDQVLGKEEERNTPGDHPPGGMLA